MSTPSEKLAESLKILKSLQDAGKYTVRSADLTRTHRERLSKNGFIQEVIKGWYIPCRPDEVAGDSTSWYASFWKFCAEYFQHLKGDDWCLSPEQSLSIHAENWTVPRQLLVRSSKARNNVTKLPHETSILDVRATLPDNKYIVEKDGLRLFSISAALVACSAGYYKQNPIDMRAALAMVRDASEVLEILLNGGHSIIAGRLAGAFRNIGRDRIADDILNTMRSAGYDVREDDPFETPLPFILPERDQSPYVSRIRLTWRDMRDVVIECFPKGSGVPQNAETYLKQVEDIYVTDAYHSLSIEGYQVSAELIERVRSGDWSPDTNERDREHRNALAARGYWQAFQAVKQSIEVILAGKNPADVVENDHRIWYREMFLPSVNAGLLKPADLAGYRNCPVFIRKSLHVPPRQEVVLDAIPALFDLLREEPEASVRAVLGHFIFVYIHPYLDGNGRIGRFLLNTMLASGGYSWMVIPVEKRNEYMAALEKASVEQDIKPFATFLARLIE